MAIHKDHLRGLIREVLHHLEPEIPYSEAAVELLMMTSAQETQLGKYLVQPRGRPAASTRWSRHPSVPCWPALRRNTLRSTRSSWR